MTDYKKWINALRKCAKEHETDRTSFGHIIVSDLCRDTADLLEALEQPCEDCISRQATVERLCKVAEFMNEKRNGLGSPYVMAALFIQYNKEEFPSVTQKQRTGHWIKDDITEWSKGAYKHKCDRCGAYHRTMYDYCPSCGAKMIEPQERRKRG